MKLIGEKLKSQDGIICVTINAWMFESYDDAKTAIMEALLQELKEEVPVEEEPQAQEAGENEDEE